MEKYNKMKILITGSNGFVGSQISEFFMKDGIQTIHFDRNDPEQNLDAEVIIHLAGIAHDTKGQYTRQDYIKANFELTKNLFEKFLNSNAKCFIFLSSSLVYKGQGKFSEESETYPTSAYQESKILAEKYIVSNTDHRKIVILRPSLIYSEYSLTGNLKTLDNILRKSPFFIFPSYGRKRSYTSINLLYRALKYISLNNIPSDIYNLSDELAITTPELIKKLCKKNGKLNPILLPKKISCFAIKFLRFLQIKQLNESLDKIFSERVLIIEKIKSVSKNEIYLQ